MKGPPQFHSPLVQHISSTQKGHSFSALKIPQYHTKNPTVQHTPQFHTKKTQVPHLKPLSSTPKTPQFQTPLSSTPKAPQFHTKNPLISSPKTPQFNTPLRRKIALYKRCGIEGFLVGNWELCGTEGFFVWNWGVCGTEGFWCGTERCVELRGFGVELRGERVELGAVLNWGILGAGKVWYLCGTDVLN